MFYAVITLAVVVGLVLVAVLLVLALHDPNDLSD